MSAQDLRPTKADLHSRDVVLSMLDYDPDTGLFWWKVNTRGKLNKGQIAGFVRSDGYVFVGIGRIKYRAARLAWFYMTGEWPDRFVDHIDGDTSNNRWGNLREADEYTNQQNRRANRHTGNPYKGIYWQKKAGKWAASIRTDGTERYLGLYSHAEDAARAYDDAALAMFGEFAKINFPMDEPRPNLVIRGMVVARCHVGAALVSQKFLSQL